MFKKLVANLPFNPSLITQVSFYTERLKAERAIRRIGFFFIAFTMVLQIFAVAYPPEKSLAGSETHILNGLSEAKSAKDNKAFLLQSWDTNADVRSIYSYFGVTREDIVDMPEVTVNIFSGNADYWTTGRNSLYAYSNVAQQYKDSQITVRYEGENTATTADDKFVYHRQLRAWDIINKNGNTYGALKGTIKSTGETFWILYDCGNFTKIGPYTPPPPPPPPPPTPTIDALCSIAGPLYIGADATTVSFPVQVYLPVGSSIPAGSTDPSGHDGDGLHLSVTTNGTPATWDKHTLVDLAPSPPDRQSDYIALPTGTSGLSYYDFVWANDGNTYRRYYVTDAHSSNFQVTVNVSIAKLDKKIVVRLLDREKGEWLPHNNACEVAIEREVPPPPETPPVVPEEPTPETPPVTPEPPTPQLEIRKTILNRPASLKPGDQYTYLIQYRNTVNASLAQNVVITDGLDTKNFTFVTVSPANATLTNGLLSLDRGNLSFDNDYEEIRITVTLKDQISSGTQVCNASRITASNTSAASSETVCIGVINPCPYDPSVPDANNPNCAAPKIVCSVVDAAVNRTSRKATYKTTVTSTNPAQTSLLRYIYDFGDGSPVVTQASTGLTNEASHTYSAGTYNTKVKVQFTASGVDGVQETTCEAPINFEDDQAVGQSKSVKNITQDKAGAAASQTLLQGNDILEYTLTTSNIQNYERMGIEISDYIGDILDYTTLDTAHLEAQGGRYDPDTKKVIWSNITIPANGQVLHTFQVKVKSPIPTTNAASSVSTTFDCKISNEYGNEITINVNCPLVKSIEKLPNTGPGSSLVMTSLITVVIGYFFARSRLLAKELDFVRQDYATTGGM